MKDSIKWKRNCPFKAPPLAWKGRAAFISADRYIKSFGFYISAFLSSCRHHWLAEMDLHDAANGIVICLGRIESTLRLLGLLHQMETMDLQKIPSTNTHTKCEVHYFGLKLSWGLLLCHRQTSISWVSVKWRTQHVSVITASSAELVCFRGIWSEGLVSCRSYIFSLNRWASFLFELNLTLCLSTWASRMWKTTSLPKHTGVKRRCDHVLDKHQTLLRSDMNAGFSEAGGRVTEFEIGRRQSHFCTPLGGRGGFWE